MERWIAIGLAVPIGYYLLRRYFCGAKYTKNTRIDGKVVIITGGNTGLGLENAVDLAKRGGKIYIACRDKERAEKALVEIKRRSNSKNVHFLQLDLSSLKSVREFSKKFHELETRLDILVNNAGIFGVPRSVTEDGFEMHMGVNHLAHFLLTNLLLDLLKSSAPSRIVIISSQMHNMGKDLRDDLMFEKNYDNLKGYANSKLANVLHCRYLAKELQGTNISVNCCHPGFVQTEIGRHTQIFHFFTTIFLKFMKKTVNEGAQTQIMLAVDPDLENVSGKYFSDCVVTTPSTKALNDEIAEWLWKKSLELTDEKKKA